MQKIMLIGNLGSDPESRFTQDGKERLQFNVAVNERRKVPQSDECTDHTDWYRVTVMGRQLEYARKLGKGSRVHVIGNLSIDAYMSRENEPRAGLNVWCDEVTNLSPRDAPTSGSAEYASRGEPVHAANERARRTTEPADALAPVNLDDLPF